MSSCEKCWQDAHRCPDVAAEYSRLIDERKDNPCTPEEQAGDSATECDVCGRRSRHQWTGECMNCGDWPEKGFHPNQEGGTDGEA